MKKNAMMFIPLLLAVVLILAAFIMPNEQTATTTDATQTPYVIYVVITATPEPQNSGVQIVNTNTETAGSSSNTSSGSVAISNATSDSSVNAAGSSNASSSGQCTYSGSNGSCTMAFELVSEPAYAAGVKVPQGEAFYKEWKIKNTGTCTWDKTWGWTFDSGWQLGNTYFKITKTVNPGDEYVVQLGITPLVPLGDQYYSTYILTAPDGATKCGTITSSFEVVRSNYYDYSKKRPWGWPCPGGACNPPKPPSGNGPSYPGPMDPFRP